MHVTKKYSLALLMGSLLASPSLIASEWSTLAARATAATGYEVRANQFRVAKVPLDYFDGLQAGAKQLTLPLPDGGEVTFTLEAYDLLPADLAAKYPQIRTFRGHNPSRPLDTGRFDLGPQGFHAMFSHQGKMVFVDPLRNAHVSSIGETFIERPWIVKERIAVDNMNAKIRVAVVSGRFDKLNL